MKSSQSYLGIQVTFLVNIGIFLFCSSSLFAQLSGTKIIDKSGGGDYLSITDAVADLNSQGVNGPLTFNLKPEIYDERVTIGNFPGASESNRVTFQALPADSGDVVLAHTYVYGSDEINNTFRFDSAHYVTINRLVFDATRGYFDLYKIIDLAGNSSNIELSNNAFYGKNYGSQPRNSLIYCYNSDAHDILIENNYFINGIFYVYVQGKSTSELMSGLTIRGNRFRNPFHTSIYLSNVDAPLVEKNAFMNTGGNCLYMSYVNNEFIIRSNTMELSGGKAIHTLNSKGSFTNSGIIANNFITNHATAAGSVGIFLNSGSQRIRIYHNSVLISNASIENTGVGFQIATTSSDIDVQNNIFSNMSGGVTYLIQNPDGLSSSDYNNYFTIGDHIAIWGQTNIASLEDLAIMGPGDSHSISIYPGFTSNDDLHTTNYLLDNKGTDLSSVVGTDIDGESRSTAPDMGADEFIGAGAPLAGNYTIGGVGADYANIRTVVDDLNQFGISAPVNFLIRDDDSPYNEQFTFLPITGADADNRVTLMPHPDNENPVELTCDHTSTTNDYIIEIEGAKHLTIKDLNFIWLDNNQRKMIILDGNCSYDSILNCTFTNYLGNASGEEAIFCSSGILTGLVLKSNRFTVGTKGIWLESSGENTLSGFRIDSNIFNNQDNYGIHLDGCKDFLIEGNYIWKGDAASIYVANISLENCTQDFKVNGNKIFHKGSSGILLNNTVADQVNPGIISNNYIYYHQQYYGGYSINCQNSQYIGIYHNTLLRDPESDPSVVPMYLTGGGNLSIKNNIICNPGTAGVAIQAGEGLLSDFSNNVLFAAGNTLINYNGTDYTFLEDLESNLGKSLNCWVFNPNFPTSGEFHTNSAVLDGAGISIPGITHDLDGELRSDPPDIGADEFTPVEGPIPAGTYTVGGVNPDYVSFSSLFNDLQIRGISGAVVFRVRKDVYPEIPDPLISIPGSDSNNTVTIESESGVPEDVFLYGNPVLTPALLNLHSVSHLTIKNITISNNYVTNGVINIRGRTQNLSFIHCIFNNNQSGSNNVDVLANSRGLLFQDNEFISGNEGLYITGWSIDNLAEETRVIKNRFTGTNRSFGITLQYQTSPQLLGNEIVNEDIAGFIGINITYCYDQILANGNKINNTAGGRGIVLTYCSAALPHRILVSNNEIHLGGTFNNTSRGLAIASCERAGLYYNSIHITSPDTITSSGIYFSNANTGMNVMNNNVSNSGGGYAYHVHEASGVFTSDFNNFHSTGTNLAKWVSTDVEGLADLQTLSGKEANSLSLDPLFVSETDLQSDEMALNEKATPLTEITYDIDSLRRDPSKPDIGAFENTCGVPKFNITVISGCLGDSTIFIDNSTGIDPGSSIGWDWDGDFVPEVYSDGMNDTVKHLFPEPGSHTVNCIVSQLLGCVDSKTLNVVVLEPPELSVETTGVYCDATDGMAAVTVLNGDGPYEYYWSDGSRNSSISDLKIEYYTVTVTDSNNCRSTKEIYIGEAIDIDVVQLGKSTCGKSDGIASVTATGGYPPYRYVWTDGDTLATDSSLVAGQHFVNVIDSKGCYARGSVTIENDGSGPRITDYKITQPKCYGEISGAIDISLTGGSLPYQFKWSNGMLTEDVDNLETGIFNVTIKDANNCIGSGSFEIIQPQRLKALVIIENSSCAGSDGKAVVVASGGTLPYSYSWSDSTTISVASGLQAGIYSVQVTDSNGCQTTEPVIVNSVGGPVVEFMSINGVGCKTTNNGAIQISVTGDGPYTYEWLPGGETTAHLNGLSPGVYKIRATDKNGCTGFNQAEITQVPPPVNPICMVTVDSATQTNRIIWEKLNTTDISHYNIYREGSYRDEYQLIGTRLVDDPSSFTDSIADPTIHSWRYKLSAVDVCGNESELSDHHKTIHLTMNLALDKSVNLIWDEYEGFNVNSYRLFRSGTLASVLEIASLSANVSSYSDKIFPDENLEYYVNVPYLTGCSISNYKAATLNATRSNRKLKLKLGTSTEDFFRDQDYSGISIYPNPSTGLFSLSFEKGQTGKAVIRVMDVTGKMIVVTEIINPVQNETYRIDMSEYQDGFYQISIESGSELYHRVIIKE